MDMLSLLHTAPVMPVLVIDRVEHAVPLARALVAGGLPVLEVTLRTAAAAEAITAITREVPDAVVGAGTVTTAQDLAAARHAGARFAVSPGLTPALARAAQETGMPFLPGVATASEALAAREYGFTALKLFPAVVLGGVALLRALHGPLPDLTFCPTGGIGPDNLHDFLSLPNVACVGGSWLAPPGAIAAGNWDTISRLARTCQAPSA